ncbi:MAG: AMP-binding protein [Oscillospiraceae bacterium]
MDKNKIKTLQDLVRESASEFGDKIFIREKNGKEISEKSFRNLYDDTRRLAGYITSKYDGVIHTAVIGGSGYAWLVSYFGTVCGGNACVPLDAQLPCSDICELLNRADVSVFMYDKRYEGMIAEIHEKCPEVKEFISFDKELPEILSENTPTELPPVSPAALASISYTSGTTGKSKGVMLLNRNLIDNAMCQDNESTPDDVVLSILPIHHIYCFTCDILCSLRYGNQLCINDSMLRISQNLKLFQPTIIMIVPMIAETIYRQIKTISEANPETPKSAIAKKIFGERLTTIYSGGAYLRPELQRAYQEMGYQMGQGYGMTECSPRITTADRFDKDCAGDVGIIVNGCQVKIEDGEIMVKSPSVMAGYYKDEIETAKAITPDGWLRTGDLGYIDGKKLFITGRKKNLIILSNGENVSPEEIENKFAGTDFISELLVYSEDGVITAEIFPNEEYCKNMTDEEIDNLFKNKVLEVNKTLTSAKTVHRMRIRNKEFEKTTSKKIIRRQSEHGKIVK